MTRRLSMLGAFALLLLLNVHNQAFATPPVTLTGAPFASTKFDDEMENEEIQAQQRDHPVFRMSGVSTIPELRAKFANTVEQSMMNQGLVRMSDKEFQAEKKPKGTQTSALFMEDDKAIVFRPKDSAALRSMVDQIVWLGSRERGRLSGTVDSLYIVVTPAEINFEGQDGVFGAVIRLTGSWKNVSGNDMFSKYYIDIQSLNASKLIQWVTTVLREPFLASTTKKLEEAATVVTTEYKIMGDQWKAVSDEKGYADKIPAKFLSGKGIDGSLGQAIGKNLQVMIETVRKGGSLQASLNYIASVENAIAKDLANFSKLTKESAYPPGFDPTAAWDAIQVAIPHDKIILEKTKEFHSILQQQ